MTVGFLRALPYSDMSHITANTATCKHITANTATCSRHCHSHHCHTTSLREWKNENAWNCALTKINVSTDSLVVSLVEMM